MNAALNKFLANSFGAAGDGTTDATAAIQLAVNAAAAAGGGAVVLGGGTYLVSGSTLTLAANVTLQGQGMDATKLHAVSGTVLKITDTALSGVRDLTIVNDSSSGVGLALHASAGHSTYRTQIERVRCTVASTGKGFRLTVGETDGIHFFPVFRDCHVEGDATGGGIGLEAVSGTDASDHVFVGLRVWGGRIALLATGIDLNGGDFLIDGTSIDGCMQTPGSGPSTARTGRGVVVRSCNASCIQNVRFENCDRNVELVAAGTGNGLGCRLIDLLGPHDLAAGKLLDNGSRTTAWGSAASDLKSGTGTTAWRVINSFERMIAFVPDSVTLTNGVNVQVGTAGSGNIGHVKIAGPTGGFTIASLRTNTIPEGSQLYLYNTTAFPMTIDDEHTADGTTATERIRTGVGAAVVRSGPSIERFVYDTAYAGGARWVYADGHRVATDATGQIGIQTAAPTTTLDLGGDSSSSKRGVANEWWVRGDGSATLRGKIRYTGTEYDILADNTANLTFTTYTGSVYVRRLYIDAVTGKVGVGANVPASKLEVQTADDTTAGAPGAFDDKFLTVGAGGSTGENVFISFDQTNHVGFIGALKPGTAWRHLVIQPASGTSGTISLGTTTQTGMKLYVQGRMGSGSGGTIASASTITLGANGNENAISGTTTINYITTANWAAGADVVLLFSTTVTLTHNAGSVPGGTASMKFISNADFQAVSGDRLRLHYDGTNWCQVR